MNALTKAHQHSRNAIALIEDNAWGMKAAGIDLMPSPGFGSIGGLIQDTANKRRYEQFRGWLYAAVNALAMECAGQPIEIASPAGSKKPGKTKSINKLPKGLRLKAKSDEYEILTDHPLIAAMEQPNPIQAKWQFIYSFIANINLTGWSFIVHGEGDDGHEFYSLPTTWVHPKHKDGPFSHFVVMNPHKPEAMPDEKDWLTKEQVAFAHLPNPTDPLSAYAPAASQSAAIRIDDHIQTSQTAFFDNGIFPSIIIKIGPQPHPDIPAGVVPRLTGTQRRQVIGAIMKTQGGVANYGHPAIVDGLIGGIEKISADSNEMGWEKSEGTVRTRILSAFAVHPYILGEAVSVGGYAQVFNIEKRFYARCNTFLDMLSRLLTVFVAPKFEINEKLMVYVAELIAQDPSMVAADWKFARTNNDVSQDEFRAERLGLPADEDGQESKIDSKLMAQIGQLLPQVTQGMVSPEQMTALLMNAGVPEDQAKLISKAPPKPEMPAPPAGFGGPPGSGGKPPKAPFPPKKDAEALAEATSELKAAAAILRTPAGYLADKVVEAAR